VPTITETSSKEQQHSTPTGTSRIVIAPTLATSKRAFIQERATVLVPEPVQRRAVDAHARRRKSRMVIEELN